MAKRRAEERLLFDSPTKRRYVQPLSKAGIRLESMVPTKPPQSVPTGGVRSPCRKRPHFLENEKAEEAAPCLTRPLCESKKPPANVLREPISESFQDECTSSRSTQVQKRPRVDHVGAEAVLPSCSDKAVGNSLAEDSIYNSFQYWRVPLPELDLSLLDDLSDSSQTKHEPKVTGSNLDAMET
uniref:Putative WW-binding domain-containing protein n=1 Tax=Nothobranchius korthausae TaxID=1143690 RepID=A0A1A8GJD4_9TELE